MNAEVKIGYKQTEAGVIPEDWSDSTVGEHFEIQLGKMLNAEKNAGVPKPYLGNKAVQWGRISFSDLPVMAMSPADIARYRLKQGDLLVCEGGEVGRAAIWNSPITECYYQKALHRLRPIRGFNTALMQALLRHWAESDLLSNFVTQTSIAHIPKEKLRTIPLPVPPAKEQEAIASALSDMDIMLSSLDQLIAKKSDIQQAAMQQLLTGQRRLPGFGGDWEVKTLSEIGTFMKGSGVTRDQSNSGELPCVRYGEIYTSHHNHIRGFQSFISKEVAASATLLKTGDLLFAGSGETKAEIGKCVAFVDFFEAYAGGDIVILRPNNSDSTFLGYALNTQEICRQKASRGQGDAVVHISANALSTIEINLPPKKEQTAIATILSDMDAEIATLEARRDKARKLKQGMMQELLTGRIRLV